MNDTLAIEHLKEILQIDTTNPPGNERLVADKLQSIFAAYGIPTEEVVYEEDRVNVIATLRGDGSSTEVIGLSGHMDVVPPGEQPWDYPPFSATEQDGKIYARGACDMKSGLMAIVATMCRLKQSRKELPFDVKCFASVGEEAGAVGAKQLAEGGYTDDVSAMIVTEPTSGNVIITHKGALWLELTTRGRTAHGSRPDRGVNALMHMVAIMNELNRSEFQLSHETDPRLGGPTMSMNVLSAGSNTNVVPDLCRLQLDIRTVPSMQHEDVIRAVQDRIDSVNKTIPELDAHISVLNDLPPMQTEEDHPFAQFVLEHFQRPAKGMTGYTDGSQFMRAQSKYPIIIWSAIRGETAHQPNEWVAIDDYVQTIEQLEGLLWHYGSR
ncbi:M20 family metallopeptidase [Geomicrobium sp. JCM 19039]|uniref:M20 family metallopeptidase n=1 Tax=Geomicrobium sp. JCM 19039 TaxID=1460636 RepID=UPI00045F28E1|nr:M20 family metallopeptidase [Geomicrobium sp. JCM 19039]GAK11548.1 acetylornithine deacetylase [Geomicrobium sp. JCM 19039]